MVELFIFLLYREQLLPQTQIVGAQNFAALRDQTDFGFQRIEFSDHAGNYRGVHVYGQCRPGLPAPPL